MVIMNLQEFGVVSGVLILAACWALTCRFLLRPSRDQIKRLPPGPRSWPLLGCLPTVGFKHRHKTFYELSKRYGPVIRAPIGATTLIIVHGPELAREMFKTQDTQFCSRPLSMQGQYLGFDHMNIVLCPFNSTWQANRKAFSTFLLSPARIASTAAARRNVICSSVASLFNQASMAAPNQPAQVNIGRLADSLIAKVILKLLFENRYERDKQGHHNQDPAVEAITKGLEEIEPDVREGIELWGGINWADYWPVLAPWDLQGWERRFRKLREKMEKLFSLIIQEHRDHTEEEDADVISVLLSQTQLSDKQLMGFMNDALIAGIDTTARPLEWAMAELVANPHVIKKAQEELDRLVGRERLMSETDIGDLVYLQAIVKEVLRLHPPAPFCDPHFNEKPASLGGYYIPANSIVMHNLWALGQDPSIWKNPTIFNPDRFLGNHESESVNVYGSNFQILPFSSGRRRCPAYYFATLTLQHVVGVLLHAFDWCPPLSTGFVDLEEGEGILIGLKNPLIASFTTRLSPNLVN